MAAYEPEPPRRGKAAQFLGGLLRVAVVLTLVLAGLYFIFTGGGRPDRHGVQNLEEERPLVGASLGDWPTDSKPLIQDFEDKIGTKVDIVDVFLDWYTPFDNVSHTVGHIAGHGALAQLSWEPHGFTTRDIVEGSARTPLRDGTRPTLDEYLNDFAEGTCRVARETQQPVLIRTMHEFNGGWFWWGIGFVAPDGTHPNTNETYRAAWIKIHDAFTSRCPGDVKFVWAVNHYSVGQNTGFMGPYPGAQYVDFIGIDGYNWGGHAQWGWQRWDAIFLEAYCAVSRQTTQPILIAEVSSTEDGGNKADWVREAFTKISGGDYPRVRGLVWFNSGKYERESKDVLDWQIDSSEASLEAFSQGARSWHNQRSLPDGPPPERCNA